MPALGIVMLGASGAVGGMAARHLAESPACGTLTLLNRRALEGFASERVSQHVVDVLSPASYAAFLPGHDTALCCLGVGQPSKMSKQDFVRIDLTAVLDFATACKAAGIRHFLLLSSVGASEHSASFYLKTKGTLQAGIAALGFERVHFFQPSMILTPTNRYGVAQALTLALWPIISPVLFGPMRKFRGIAVDVLGRAMAKSALAESRAGVAIVQWDEITALDEKP